MRPRSSLRPASAARRRPFQERRPAGGRAILLPRNATKGYPTQKLCDTLYHFTKAAPESCPGCGRSRDLRLTLDVALGAGDTEYKVVSALLPEKLESWLGEEEEEVMYSLPRRARDVRRQAVLLDALLACDRQGRPRFGQHAVCLDKRQFESLIEQVNEKLQPVLTCRGFSSRLSR